MTMIQNIYTLRYIMNLQDAKNINSEIYYESIAKYINFQIYYDSDTEYINLDIL